MKKPWNIALAVVSLSFATSQIKAQTTTTTISTPINMAFAMFAPPSTAPADQAGAGFVEVVRMSVAPNFLPYGEPVPACSSFPCTMVIYSFCGVTLVQLSGCLQGLGFIPNADFGGSVGTSYTTTNTLTLNVDTATVAGFTNELCTAGTGDGNLNDCTESTAATGGVIQLTWQKTPTGAQLSSGSTTYVGTAVPSGESSIVLTASNIDDSFSATATGTVLGVSADTPQFFDDPSPDPELLTAAFLNLQDTVSKVTAPTGASPAAIIRLPSEVAAKWGIPKPVVKKMQVLEGRLALK